VSRKDKIKRKTIVWGQQVDNYNKIEETDSAWRISSDLWRRNCRRFMTEFVPFNPLIIHDVQSSKRTPLCITGFLINPFMPTVAFNICFPRDCVSRTANVERNGGQKWVKGAHFNAPFISRSASLSGSGNFTSRANWGEKYYIYVCLHR